ncbi:Uncharacterised protein [Legionella pneumophila]|uniref:hypothetical protein n=1 Tax=Legionella pneumophila TaxID=446 RepID=UPI000770B1AF|nr:hypothetical protein [Legionella pneumophila]CZJ91260.1 Uncharacterised protein [Legionella pneumophila]CZJ94726.1 Uncharacterised protein [Legionella pneumophila]CZK41858.1 Uncharacterised protein [Legionella pneumophila]CZK45214.1 Uncharacterised protein [Legionella pneumophila]CZK60283.1 Uncharacterised protein [Legionella pneumophila]
MDFIINENELGRLCGLPHIQQLTYLRGIRPYMDIKTGIAGIKRRISHQSISEQLYVEPHQGIKCQNFSRDQVRRAVSGLVRAGLIEVQSEGMHLILKCLLASPHYSVQNKAAINPPQKAAIKPRGEYPENTGLSEVELAKADTVEPPKAAIPHKDNYYIYLLSQFEKFWSLYPEKKSKNNAQAVFEELKPSADLFHTIINALNAQINHRDTMKLQGTWVPPWKYPANWLAQRCWEDELPTDALQEKHHAEHTKNTRKRHTTEDLFCPPRDAEERGNNNVIQLQRYLQS